LLSFFSLLFGLLISPFIESEPGLKVTSLASGEEGDKATSWDPDG